MEGNNTIGWKAQNANLLKTISISTDGGATWTSKESSTAGTTLATLNTGDKLLIKGSNTAYSNASNYYNQFTATGNFNVEGNIMSMIYGDNFVNQTTLSGDYTFQRLFYKVTGLINTENLILPATTLASYCYQQMFNGCSSLTIAPELPATTLAKNCYSEMFQGCTSLTTAPKLPATTLAAWCYSNMFRECTGLTTAPELPATTLANQCYYSMFSNCTSLNYIKCLATDISATDCTINWVTVVAATGTFVKAALTNWNTGTSGIPSGWTVQDAA